MEFTMGRRKYDKQFKKDVVELLKTSNKTITDVANDLGIRRDLLSRWNREFEEENKIPFACSKKKRIVRIMQENGLVARSKRRFKATTDSSYDYPISPNLINQKFTVESIHSCWVSDITYVHTLEV